MREEIIVVPIVFESSMLPGEKEQAEKLAEERDKMLSSGYTVKETRLAVFNHGVYAHYVMRKEQ